MLRRLVRWTALLIVILIVVLVTAVYTISERALKRVYPVDVSPVAIPATAEAIARGEHIAHAVGSCTMCHGDDVGGRVYADMGALGVIVGSNLTRGRGGVGGTFSDSIGCARLGTVCGVTERHLSRCRARSSRT